jgi:twinkle protein
MRDYTEQEANDAIDRLCDEGRIMIGDLEGRKDVASVMEVMEEALAMGYEYFIIDNLTAFEHSGAGDKQANKVDAIDETMKRLGTFKDENEVFILLLSHLKKVYGERTPHEEGGRVSIQDFRGAGSITFWANDVVGICRNTGAESFAEKCLTTYENLKNRDVGHRVGSKIYASMNMKTGRLLETTAPPEAKKFDDGTGPKKKAVTDEKDF